MYRKRLSNSNSAKRQLCRNVIIIYYCAERMAFSCLL
jgi:hypothetical protein